MKPQALIIEDCVLDQVIHKIILESLNFECVVVSGGEEAVSHLNDTQFSLILLDLNLPQINGNQILMGYRSSVMNKSTPVVVVSSTISQNHKEFLRTWGAQLLIEKPLNTKLEVLKEFSKSLGSSV